VVVGVIFVVCLERFHVAAQIIMGGVLRRPGRYAVWWMRFVVIIVEHEYGSGNESLLMFAATKRG